MAVTKLVLVRHGESEWNKENRFTGWTDVELSEKGRAEAQEAGQLLKKEGFSFDFAYTSVLKRAIHTLWNILDQVNQQWLPVEKSWKLNERHYGALQGLDKAETAAKYGDEQVKLWRRGFAITPPALEKVMSASQATIRVMRNWQKANCLPLRAWRSLSTALCLTGLMLSNHALLPVRK